MRRLIHALHSLSIRSKLTAIGLVTSLATLLIVCICFLVFDQISYRRQLVVRAQTLARIVGTNSKAALAFRDADVAATILGALAAEEDVHAARLCEADNEPLATYRGWPVSDALWDSAAWPSAPVEEGGYLLIKEPLLLDGEHIGTVRLAYSMRPVANRLLWGIALAGVVFGAAVGTAILLSWILQRLVSRPILTLTDTVGHITAQQDFSERAGPGGPDEIGDLVRGFNSMLDQIELRDAELLKQQGRLREMADYLLRTEERERRRIANGIHDTICQLLGGALLHAQHLGGTIERSEIRSGLNELIEIMREALDIGRTLSFELSPPSLYELGLGSALTALATEMQENYGMAVTVVGADMDTALSNDVRIVLYRACRELLMNVHKHAAVKEARVELTRAEGRVSLRVSDEGDGFDDDRVDYSSGGFGLFSIREHMRVLEGSFAIDSTPGQGTRITIEVPEPEA